MASISLTISANVRRRCVPFSLRRYFTTTDLDRWQRRCDRLAQLQRSIRFPPLQTLTVHGETYELPLVAAEPFRTPSQEELEYLVGFFDGDGCVSMVKSTGQVRLAVGQTIESAEVLLHFRSLLGSGVYAMTTATGSRKATVQWSVSGTKMQEAAAALSSIPSMKQAQLEIAMRGRVGLDDRNSVEQKLKIFKRKQHVPGQLPNCSWPYLAGFFDAEGSIVVKVNFGMRLTLEQVNPRALIQLQSFLHRNQLQGWSLYHYARSSVLGCWELGECKGFLERLLAHGLLVKRKQAELALTLSAENHLEIRDAISALNGWQKRYQRLDREGIARTTEIRRLQIRLRSRVGLEYAFLQCQLDDLRSVNALQKLISRSTLLRNDMRQALREGGHLTPFSSS